MVPDACCQTIHSLRTPLYPRGAILVRSARAATKLGAEPRGPPGRVSLCPAEQGRCRRCRRACATRGCAARAPKLDQLRIEIQIARMHQVYNVVSNRTEVHTYFWCQMRAVQQSIVCVPPWAHSFSHTGPPRSDVPPCLLGPDRAAPQGTPAPPDRLTGTLSRC